MAKLESSQGAFTTELDKIGVTMHELDGLQRLQLMNSILRPHKPQPKAFPPALTRTQDWCAPQEMVFEQAYVQLDEKVGQLLYVEDFPL